MTTREKFEGLKEREINAKSDAEHAQINAELERLADNDPVEFEASVIASARQTLADAKALRAPFVFPAKKDFPHFFC